MDDNDKEQFSLNESIYVITYPLQRLQTTDKWGTPLNHNVKSFWTDDLHHLTFVISVRMEFVYVCDKN